MIGKPSNFLGIYYVECKDMVLGSFKKKSFSHVRWLFYFLNYIFYQIKSLKNFIDSHLIPQRVF